MINVPVTLVTRGVVATVDEVSSSVVAEVTLEQRVLTVPVQSGVRGEKGDTGPQGAQGAKGDDGEPGPPGAKGDPGSSALMNVFIQDDSPGNLAYPYLWTQTNYGGTPGRTTQWIYTPE